MNQKLKALDDIEKAINRLAGLISPESDIHDDIICLECVLSDIKPLIHFEVEIEKLFGSPLIDE